MNPTILISGCTKGIGLAIVNIFSANGFNVAGCARNNSELKLLHANLTQSYPNQLFFFESCDVSNTASLKQFAQKAINTFKSIEVLVNNAGIFMPGTIIDEPENALEIQFQTNVASAYYLCQIIGKNMLEAGQGHIFNICSTASITAYTNGGSYCISKYAMLGLNQVLRQELKDKNIKVTALLPGATLTDSWKGTELPDERFIPANDIAKLVYNAYTLSPQTNVEEILVRPIKGDIG